MQHPLPSVLHLTRHLTRHIQAALQALLCRSKNAHKVYVRGEYEVAESPDTLQHSGGILSRHN